MAKRDVEAIKIDLEDALIKKLHIKASQADAIVKLIDDLIIQHIREFDRSEMWEDDYGV